MTAAGGATGRTTDGPGVAPPPEPAPAPQLSPSDATAPPGPAPARSGAPPATGSSGRLGRWTRRSGSTGTAAPLREAHRAERAVRVLLVLLVVAGYAAYRWPTLDRPRYVDDGYAVLRDAATGALREVDLAPATDGLDEAPVFTVLWRNDDGLYYSRIPVDGFEINTSEWLERAVRAQPYVAAHPGSVTFRAIDPEPDPRFPSGFLAIPILGSVFMMVSGPRPRWATKWAWFFVCSTGYGLPVYLLLAGSWFRSRTEPPHQPINGWMVWLGLAVVRPVFMFAPLPEPNMTPPYANRAGYVPPSG